MPTENYTYDEQHFEWDTDKNLSNIRKHGVPFKEAATVFSDYDSKMIEDEEHSDTEQRFKVIGFSKTARLLTVCHCVRRSENVTRIISARRADRTEKDIYGGAL